MPRLVDHEERRAHLLAALWRVVERDGAASISIRHVATEAQVSKSAIAHYFPNRLSLLSAAVEQLHSEAAMTLSRLDLDDGQVQTAVEAVCLAIPDSARRRTQSEVWLLLISERRTDPAVRRLAMELDDRVRATIAVTLSRWVESGLIHRSRDLDIETRRLHGLIDGLSLHVLHDPETLTNEKVRRIVATHLSELAHGSAELASASQ